MQAKRTGGCPMTLADDRLPVSAARAGRDSSHGSVRAKPAPRRKARRDTPAAAGSGHSRRTIRLAVGMDALSRCDGRGCGGSRCLCSAPMAELTALDDIDDKIGDFAFACPDVSHHILHELAIGCQLTA